MRPAWSSVPASLRAELERILGFEVVRADSQSGGYSPGVAAVVHGADGQRAFVKAVSAEVNAWTPGMHRDEARFVQLLPPDHGSPRLIGTCEDGPWVALALEAVDGRPPAVPWVASELDAALEAVRAHALLVAPPELPTVQEAAAGELVGWRTLRAESACLTTWEDRWLSDLVALEEGWEDAAVGDAWLHADLRGDNMLVRPDGSVVIVDWPWSCRGASVFDALCFVPSAVRDGALGAVPAPERLAEVPDALLAEACEALLARLAPDAAAEQVDPLLAAFAGLMQQSMRKPVPVGMPTVRAFQADQGRIACAWLAARRGWR